MKFFLVFSCVIISAYGYNPDSTEHGVADTGISPNCTCGWANKGGERIVNGRTTKTFEYPMLAGLVKYRTIVCGGAIITKKHVVTAAHCVIYESTSSYSVHVGSYSYEIGKHGDLHKIEKYIIHPNYDDDRILYDIAIVKIKDTFNFGSTIGPVCLPSGPLNLVGEHLKVLGWGKLSVGGKFSPVLLQTYLQVKEHEFCHTVNRDMAKRDRHQLCTFTKGTDACQGDSGGPLLWRNPVTNRYTLAAVVSYGVDCALYPAVNTEVAYFVSWIQKAISRDGVQTCS